MSLLDFLKKNENARKVFGKRELKIIEKQLFGLTLSQSEKNRLSRDIRKKLDFIREAARFSQEFDLKHGLKVKELVERAKDEILNTKYQPFIKRIVLFGSTAERLRHLGSDVDIAVEFDDIDIKEATEFRIKVSYSDMIDIQVYNVLPAKIKKEIDEKGKIIYEREQKSSQ